MYKQDEYCMDFSNAEIVDWLVLPLSKHPEINIRLSSEEDEELHQDTKERIEYISIDGEKSEFYIRFLGCETAIFILNEEFMFIDDDTKKNYSLGDTFHNVVYEGLLRSKSHKEILELLCEFIMILINTKEITIVETLLSENEFEYPKYSYTIKLIKDNELQKNIQYENILFSVNE